MTNAEIVTWHRNAARQLRAASKEDYAKEHDGVAQFFEEHPELDDNTLDS